MHRHQQQQPAAFQWDGFDQVRALQDHNTQLLQQLDQQARELEQLREAAESGRRTHQHVADATPIPDAGQRIHQLSKKLREYTAKLEAEQVRSKKGGEQCAALEQTVATLQDEIERLRRREKKLENRLARLADPFTAGHDAEDTPTDHRASRQESQPDSKQEIYALRNQVSSLRKDVQMAHRALTKEVGDDVTVAQVLSADGSWKGRAEQITYLKMKLAEAQAHVQDASFDGTRASTVLRDDKAVRELRKAEAERRAAMDKLAADHQAAVDDNAQLRKKHEALKARAQSLSQDLKEARERLDQAAAKGRRDDDTITACNNQIQQLRATQQSVRSTDVSMAEAKASLEQLCTTQHDAITRLQQQIDDIERARKLQRRQHEKELERASEQMNAMKIEMGEEQHLLQMQLQQQQAIQQQLLQQLMLQQQHIKQQGSNTSVTLPPIKPPSRAASTKPPSSASSRASSATRAPDSAQPAANHRVCDMRLAEVTALHRASDAERAKLFELVEVHKRHTSEMQAQIETLEVQLRTAQQARLRLEKDLASMTGKITEAPSSKRVSDLEGRLAISEDENAALKESTRAQLRRKDDEIAVLNSMMTEMKRICGDSIKSIKQAASTSRNASVDQPQSFAPRPPSASRGGK